MIKILLYELKRLLLNKFFFALLAVTSFYCYQALSGEIILGVAGTAPFSKWSYGFYLARILPLMLITLLFFVTFLYSKKEKQVQVLTGATPIDTHLYGFIKSLAIMVGFLLISVVVVAISFVFYGSVFRYTEFSGFFIPILMAFIPAMFFVMGLGFVFGRIHPGLLYVLMLAMLLLSFITLPYGIDLIGNSFFQNYPQTLPLGVDGEPAFTVPAIVWGGKILYSIAGIILISYGVSRLTEVSKAH